MSPEVSSFETVHNYGAGVLTSDAGNHGENALALRLRLVFRAVLRTIRVLCASVSDTVSGIASDIARRRDHVLGAMAQLIGIEAGM
jgi:hypothetical protein